MHVLQWIAVEAEDKDMAYRTVLDSLESKMGDEYNLTSWYDWFIVGGGRWNIEEGENWKEAYAEGKTNLIVSAKDDPQAFKDRIANCMENRKVEFERYAKQIEPNVIDNAIRDYNPVDPDYKAFSPLYPIQKVIDMVYGNWDFNSYFYDIVNDTIAPKYVLEAIDKEPDNWYLVPVDFHF
jgi:hypothetical protein